MSHCPLIAISFLFFCLSILNPVHTLPWGSFFSEFFCFVAALILLSLLFRSHIEIPKITLPFLLISAIPLLQLSCSQIFYFSIAFFSFVNLFYFWLMIIVGFNFCSKDKKILDVSFFLAVFFLVVSFISSLIALSQWLGFSNHSTVIMSFEGSRPYANMAQPNHLATYLCLGIFSCWYLFEKNKFHGCVATILCLFLIFTVILTQSRTAMLILLFSAFYIFLNIKKYDLKLSKIRLITLFAYFIGSIFFFPILNTFLSKYFDIAKANSLIDRAAAGYERLAIWGQMLNAVKEKPWLGYGWNQTTSAQFNVVNQGEVHVWLKSSHNIILDIFVWCGIPLGIIIILFITYFYLKIFLEIEDKKDIFCFLAISAVVMHSMLEFPMYYSYFFIPVGLLVGILLKKEKNKCIKANSIVVVLIFFISLGGLIGVFKEYMKIDDNLFAGKLHAMGDLRTKVDLPHHLYFFDFFDARARWLALYPKQKVSEQQLIDAKKMVQTYLKPYDLYKYAQLLAFNDKKQEAKEQLEILHTLYGVDMSYGNLFDESMSKEVNSGSNLKE
ncbi:hypothetical protein Acal02_01095 [Acinetobacter calcoaceticus]